MPEKLHAGDPLPGSLASTTEPASPAEPAPVAPAKDVRAALEQSEAWKYHTQGLALTYGPGAVGGPADLGFEESHRIWAMGRALLEASGFLVEPEGWFPPFRLLVRG